MALSRLDSLYMAVVSDHSKNPHHHGKLEDVDQVNLNNPTCGDMISLSVKFDGDRISDIAAEIFSKMVQGEKDDAQKRLGEASFLAGVSKFPQRIKCSTLAWNALKKAIENDSKNTER